MIIVSTYSLHRFLQNVNMKTHKQEFLKGDVQSVSLKDLRLRDGLTQQELARKLNVDQASVSNWEKGKNPPLPKYRKQLCRIFKCTEAEL